MTTELTKLIHVRVSPTHLYAFSPNGKISWLTGLTGLVFFLMSSHHIDDRTKNVAKNENQTYYRLTHLDYI